MNNIVKELKQLKAFFISTIDGDQPRVRPFLSSCEFENNAYICSGNFKDFYKQIKKSKSRNMWHV